MAGILGVTCFALEDIALRHKVNVVHAIWHCFACLSMAKLEPLLQDSELHRPGQVHAYAPAH